MLSDTKYADDIARRRQDNAERTALDPRHGAPEDPAEALWLNIVGARCECAAYLFYRCALDINILVWHQYVDGNPHGLADLDDFIDVKGRPEHWQDLIVRPNDRPDWAYLLVRAHKHPDYEIVGWCWGREAKQDRYKLNPRSRGEAHFVKGDDPIIRPPRSLYEELQRRHGESYQWF